MPVVGVILLSGSGGSRDPKAPLARSSTLVLPDPSTPTMQMFSSGCLKHVSLSASRRLNMLDATARATAHGWAARAWAARD